MQKIISLSTKEELSIYMSPQRQQILRAMSIQGRPMTAKALADKLGISASSAAHHISKLKQLGIVEEDHTEVINGIVARFYRLADATVSIGLHIEDGFSEERDVLIQNIIHNTWEGYKEGIAAAKQKIESEGIGNDYGDFLGGVVYLTREDSKELKAVIADFIEAHKTRPDDAQPWEYALIYYNTEFTS